MIAEFLKKPFHLLEEPQSRRLLVIVIGVFGVLFMNLYTPFNVRAWYSDVSMPLFLVLSSFGLIGMLVMGVSQIALRHIFHIQTVSVGSFILWFLVELVLLTITMFIIYGNTSLSGSALAEEIFLTFKYTLLVVIIPYAGVLLYLGTTQKRESFDALVNAGDHLVNILDENGELHLAVDLEQILFLKSADNYVSVYFLKDGKTKKELVRTTMKRLETELQGFPIRRCHRSYMVNIKKISLSLRSTQGLTLTLHDFPEEQIPVSKNYAAFFTRLLSQKTATSSAS